MKKPSINEIISTLTLDQIFQGLKDSIQTLLTKYLNKSEVILEDDSNTYILCFCLEKLLLHGIKGSLFTNDLSNLWEFFSHLEECLPGTSILKNVKDISKNNVARARIFIRMALNEGAFGEYIFALAWNASLMKTFYKDDAFMKREDELSILEMLLKPLSTVSFSLWVNNKQLEEVNFWETVEIDWKVFQKSNESNFTVSSSSSSTNTHIPVQNNGNTNNKRSSNILSSSSISDFPVAASLNEKNSNDNLSLPAIEATSLPKSKEHKKKKKTKVRTIADLKDQVETPTASSGPNVSNNSNEIESKIQQVTSQLLTTSLDEVWKPLKNPITKSAEEEQKELERKNQQLAIQKKLQEEEEMKERKLQEEEEERQREVQRRKKLQEDEEIKKKLMEEEKRKKIQEQEEQEAKKNLEVEEEKRKQQEQEEQEEQERKKKNSPDGFSSFSPDSSLSMEINNSSSNNLSNPPSLSSSLEMLPTFTIPCYFRMEEKGPSLELSSYQFIEEYVPSHPIETDAPVSFGPSNLILEIPKKEPLLKGQTCANCGEILQLGMFNKAYYCYYTGQYFCKECHNNAKSIIPARIIQHWDRKEYPVSIKSRNHIQANYRKPLINLNIANPNLYEHDSALKTSAILRRQLRLMEQYIDTCRSQQMLLDLLSDRVYLLREIHVYSLRDLMDTKSMLQILYSIMEKYIEHITKNCETCRGKGHFCEICNTNDLIFSFQTNVIYTCKVCGGLYHEICVREVIQTKTKFDCPKCQRKLNSKKKFV